VGVERVHEGGAGEGGGGASGGGQAEEEQALVDEAVHRGALQQRQAQALRRERVVLPITYA